MAQIFKVEPVGAMVSLLEYQGLPGMILASEVSRRRFRSIKQVISVGKIIPCTVIRVDESKGYIDLSKKRVSPNDAKQVEDRYAHSRNVHSIMARVANLTGNDLEALYEMFCWDLYKQFDHAFFAFNAIANNDLTVLDKYEIPEEVKNALITVIKQKMAPKPASIYARVEATCFGSQGVAGLKEAFKVGLDCSTEDVQLRVRIVGPPVYVITTTCNVPSKGLQIMKLALEKIGNHLNSIGGKLVCHNGPQMTESDLDINRLVQEDDEEADEDDEDEDDDEDDEYDE
jgi:translation initiation factor 2 subunit 1